MNINDKSKQSGDLPESGDSFTLNDDPIFNFDLLEPDAIPASEEVVIDTSEIVRTMQCLCPKCSETITIDLSQMPEDGFVTQCTSCNTTIHIIRESCACRAKRQSHEICCANCGSRLDQHVHCNSCGLIFPDYFIPVNLDDARRKARKDFFDKKWSSLKDLNFSFKPVFSGRSQEVTHGYTPQKTIGIAASKSRLLTRRVATITLALIVTVALSVTGVFAYKAHQFEKIYVKNYFRALYGIKTGVDSNLQTCLTMKSEWETASKSGMRYSPLVNTKNEIQSAKLRGEIDKIMKTASDPPKKLVQSKKRLQSLYKIYMDSDVLINSKPNSLQEFSAAIDKLDNKMKIASNEFKSNLPDSLNKELAIAKLKYRGLKDF